MSLVTKTLQKHGDKVFFTWNDSDRLAEAGSVWVQLEYGEAKLSLVRGYTPLSMPVKIEKHLIGGKTWVELTHSEVHCLERDVGREVWASLRRNGWKQG